MKNLKLEKILEIVFIAGILYLIGRENLAAEIAVLGVSILYYCGNYFNNQS